MNIRESEYRQPISKGELATDLYNEVFLGKDVFLAKCYYPICKCGKEVSLSKDCRGDYSSMYGLCTCGNLHIAWLPKLNT